MGFRQGSYAKVWEVSGVSDTNTKLRISISRKNKQSGEYEQDFSGFVNCIGTSAAAAAMRLSPGARIKIGDCDVTTRYDKEKSITYTNYKIFSFESDGDQSNQPRQRQDGGSEDPAVPVDTGEQEEESDLPF